MADESIRCSRGPQNYSLVPVNSDRAESCTNRGLLDGPSMGVPEMGGPQMEMAGPESAVPEMAARLTQST